MSKEGYKGHRPGSNAGKIHKAFDEGGDEAAKKMGARLELEPHTVRAMLSIWKRGVKRGGTAKKAAKTKRVTRTAKKGAKRPVRPVRAAAKKATAKKAAPRVARAPKPEAEAA